MSDKFVTKSVTHDDWVEEYAPGYKEDKNYPKSAQMCLICKDHHEANGKMWPPCGNKDLNRELQFEMLDDSGALEDLTPEEKFGIQKEMDPVVWAISEFEFDGKPWIPRWYQEFSMRCSSVNKALMWGRRCLTPDTPVLVGNRYHKLSEVNQGVEVPSLKGKEFVDREVGGVFDNGEQPVYKITLTNGLSITATSNHPLWVKRQTSDYYWSNPSWVSIEDGLSTGDRVAVSTKDHGYGKKSDPGLAAFLGLMITDGSTLKANDKIIPDVVYSFDRESLGLFLNRMWAGDGNISVWHKGGSDTDYGVELGMTTASHEMAEQLRLLLLSHGIFGRVKTYTRKSPKSDKQCTGYKLRVTNSESILRLLDLMGPVKGKEDKCARAREKLSLKSNKETYPQIEGDISWFKVKSIEEGGTAPTLDISVPGTENFIANGIVTHNTGKSECQIVECLWYARFRKGADGADKKYAIHVFANSERLINDHWEKFKLFIRSGRELASLDDGGRQGKTIKLKNNVIIHFHVLSMKVVGLDAYYMWFDEAAFYFENEKALPHALATRNSRPNMPVTMTSNSSGFRGRFYEYCHNKDTFYLNLPSYVNPTWGPKMEMDARQNYTANDYDLLFKASWGESERAVFSPRDIRTCLDKYEFSYDQVNKRKPEGVYRCLGCDWNEALNGVHFVVVEYDSRTPPYGKPLYTVIKKSVISGNEWNHEVAEKEAWRLLIQYQCDSAYLDYGGGGSRSVDYLKRRCQKEGRHLLARNIVEINMSSMEDIPDSVFPGLYTKKRMKNLIVNQCQISLQKHEFRFPYEENEEMYERHKRENIIPQMRAFAVEKVDARGFAIYSRDIEEHTLTAWMLAVWGCKVNCTDDLYGANFMTLGMAWGGRETLPSEDSDEPDPGSDEVPGPKKDVKKEPEPDIGINPMFKGRAPGWFKGGFSRTRGFGEFRRF